MIVSFAAIEPDRLDLILYHALFNGHIRAGIGPGAQQQALHDKIKVANDCTKVVPGHGPLPGKTDLVEYRMMLVSARDRMVKWVVKGRSEDDVVATKPFSDIDAKWGVSEQGSRNFIRVVFHSLKNWGIKVRVW